MTEKNVTSEDKIKAKRLARYQGESKQDRAPTVTKAFREYISDPLTDAVGKVMPGTRMQDWERMDREARKEVLGYKKGGAVNASKRADGIAQRGKTRGKIV